MEAWAWIERCGRQWAEDKKHREALGMEKRMFSMRADKIRLHVLDWVMVAVCLTIIALPAIGIYISRHYEPGTYREMVIQPHSLRFWQQNGHDRISVIELQDDLAPQPECDKCNNGCCRVAGGACGLCGLKSQREQLKDWIH